MGMRTIILALMLTASAVSARADERLTSFESRIVVSREGDMKVTETIEIVSEDDRFRKGINRDLELPRSDGKLDIASVTLDGEATQFRVEDRDGVQRIRIRPAERPLSRGSHSIEIVYRIDKGIIEATDHDMFSWDVAGAWDVRIENVSASIKLPSGTRILDIETLAGTPDRPRDDLERKEKAGALTFSTSLGLDPNERLLIKLRLPRNAIGPADEE